MNLQSNLYELGPVVSGNRAKRLIWNIARLVVFRPTPIYMHHWRCIVLRTFGADVAKKVYPYPDVKIWAPWNLELAEGSCLGPGVDCYNVAKVSLGEGVTVSQRSYLCTASHDFDNPDFTLIGGEIRIEAQAWVAAEAFIGPGITIGERSVVLARSVVVRDVATEAVVGGNPAKIIRHRC